MEALLGADAVKLNQKKIERLKDPRRYGDGRNLYLSVGPTGNKHWLFVYQRNHRQHMIGLGSLRYVSLEEARELAAEYRKLLRQGIEPPRAERWTGAANAATEAKNRRGSSFQAVAERYIAAHKAEWKHPKSEEQWRNSLARYAFPLIGQLDVAAIEAQHLNSVLAPIWTEKADTARRVRWRIGKVLGFAIGEDLRPDTDLPTRTGGKLDHMLPKRSKQRATNLPSMAYAAVPPFIARLREEDGIAPRALDFLILTGARTSEVLGAAWDEIDFDKAVWTVPAERMKAGREHRVPLTDEALALLKALPRDPVGFVFINPQRVGKPLSNMAMVAVLRRMKSKTGVTVHGFRATFRTWAAEECLDVPREIAEAVLAHRVGGVEGAYQRGDYFLTRRKLMERWAAYCRGDAP